MQRRRTEGVPDSEAAATLPELVQLEAILSTAPPELGIDTACEVRVGRHRLPVPVIRLGSTSPDSPAIAFVGGVHGLERIGSALVLECLRQIVRRLP